MPPQPVPWGDKITSYERNRMQILQDLFLRGINSRYELGPWYRYVNHLLMYSSMQRCAGRAWYQTIGPQDRFTGELRSSDDASYVPTTISASQPSQHAGKSYLHQAGLDLHAPLSDLTDLQDDSVISSVQSDFSNLSVSHGINEDIAELDNTDNSYVSYSSDHTTSGIVDADVSAESSASVAIGRRSKNQAATRIARSMARSDSEVDRDIEVFYKTQTRLPDFTVYTAIPRGPDMSNEVLSMVTEVKGLGLMDSYIGTRNRIESLHIILSSTEYADDLKDLYVQTMPQIIEQIELGFQTDTRVQMITHNFIAGCHHRTLNWSRDKYSGMAQKWKAAKLSEDYNFFTNGDISMKEIFKRSSSGAFTEFSTSWRTSWTNSLKESKKVLEITAEEENLVEA